MNIYSHDIRVWATAYVRANSEDEAREALRAFLGEGLHVSGEHIDGRPYAALEDAVTLSPAMTVDPEQDLGAMDMVDAPDPIEAAYREAAQTHPMVSGGVLEVDADATVSIGDDGGAYVSAWLWVDAPETEGGA
jgi:hypothetical protein